MPPTNRLEWLDSTAASNYLTQVSGSKQSRGGVDRKTSDLKATYYLNVPLLCGPTQIVFRASLSRKARTTRGCKALAVKKSPDTKKARPVKVLI